MHVGYKPRHAMQPQKHSRGLKGLAVTGAAAVFVVTGAAGAFADNLQADLNVSSNGQQKTLDLGTLAGGTPTTQSVFLFVDVQPGGANDPTYPFNVTGATTSGSIPAAFPGVTISAAGSANGQSADVSFTTPVATVADASYKVLMAFDAGGSAVNDGPASMELDFKVLGTGVVDPCASVGAPAAPTWNNGGSTWSTTPLTPDANSTTSDATITYSVDSGTFGAATSLTDGTYSVVAKATSATCNKTSLSSAQPFKIDTIAPVISDGGVFSGTLGTSPWYTSAVVESFTIVETGSGLANSVTSPLQVSSTGEGASVTISSGTVSDVAGNVSSSVTSPAYSIDLNNPTVTCPATASTFTLGQTGQVVTADVTDTSAGSGAASPTATGNADTSSVGTKSVSITGYDNAGRSGSASCSYNVIYNWTGFFQPVDINMLNSAKAGSAIPVKFNLGGNQGLEAVLSEKSSPSTCDVAIGDDAIEQTVTAGSSSLTYDDSASQYVYVWKSDRSWAGTCRQLTVTLADGTTHSAKFRFTK